MPLVSFIIPAHNEENDLPRTLGAINAAIRELALDAEVIVANDASTDRTVDIATAHGARVVSHERRQIAATRNLGAKASTGAFLFFIDADTQATTAAIKQGLHAMQSGRAIAGGAMPYFDGHVPFFARVMTVVFIRILRLANLCGGAFFFCKRDAFSLAGGWDEAYFAGEEIHFAQALKKHGRFTIVPARIITSGRKLRTYSPREVITLMLRLGLGGRKAVQNRDKLGMWYDQRRADPFHASIKSADAATRSRSD